MLGTPLVKPAAPELRAHLGGVGTQLAQATELIVNIGTCAEIHCPYEVIQAILLEIRGPVALKQRQFFAVDAT